MMHIKVKERELKKSCSTQMDERYIDVVTRWGMIGYDKQVGNNIKPKVSTKV